jgi:DNA-binding HxlR family transcriptional regulator/putative sterol carrier protein
MTREYGQFCGLARALELIGGRWTLLIIRELMVGPRRYTELEEGLPGIPTNVLSSRLREMEDSGLVERVLQARPSRSVVYALTPYGLELWDPMRLLGLWGAKSLGKPRPGDFFSDASLELALRATFDASAAQDDDVLFEIRLAERRLYVHVRDQAVSFPSEPSSPSDVVLETTPEVFAELFAGHTDIDAALATRRARVHGPKREGRRLFKLFHLPADAGLAP